MIHNKEIGVLYDTNNPSDQEIYSDALKHIKFIEDNSNDKPFELNSGNAMQSNKVEKPYESKQHKTSKVQIDNETKSTEKFDKQNGYCIRCGVDLKLNPEQPLCFNCYKSWEEYSNPTYKEKFCHICGKESDTSYGKPICYSCYKKINK